MAGQKYSDFSISTVRGDPLTITATLKLKGVAVDLSTYSEFEFFVKGTPAFTDSDALIELTMSGGHITVMDATHGVIQAVCPATATNALENVKKILYVDVLATDAQGNTWVMSQGKVHVLAKPAKPAPFAPHGLTGLKLWLKADSNAYAESTLTTKATTDGAGIGGWKGVAGPAHRLTQITNNLRPRLKLAAFDGLPALASTGSGYGYLAGQNLSTFISAGEFSLFIIGKANAGGTGAVATWPSFCGDGDGNFCIGPGDAGKIGVSLYDGGSTVEVKADYTFGDYALIEAHHGSGVLGVRVDGGTEITASAGSTHLSGILYLFAHQNASPLLNGEIGEIILYDVDLLDADKAKVRTYLNKRWGVPSFSGDVTAP